MGDEKTHQYELSDEVRDNEADLAGVVNHAHYLNYMANARHKHLRILGLDFQAMLAQGYMLVATKIEIRYRLPLFVGDRYCVTSKISELHSKVFDFEHHVFRLPDRKLVAEATVRTACVDCESNTISLPQLVHDRIESEKNSSLLDASVAN